jgi:mycoredoxin
MDSETEIVMYTTSWCSDCQRAKHFLDEYGIDYMEHDVDHDSEAKRFVMEVNNGRSSVPTIIFPDGSILVEPSNQELGTKLNIDLDHAFI